MLRDFWGGSAESAAGVLRSIIPSFREDDESDVSSSAALEPYLRQLPGEPYILFVGALRQVKGIQPLLAAYERLKTSVPLVLIGTFERDTPRTFPAGVRVLQDFPHQAVMAAWDRSLFGVVPSLWPEPLGSVVYEGMSRGKAMIGTTPGGHTDMIVDQETGFLVPPGDVEALTQAMRRLLDQAVVREAFGQRGRERAQQFTARQVVPQFERLYYSVISGKPQRIDETTIAKLDN
jgi:glycosyltransferase involved in cell wall biosynthesis